MGNVQLNSFHGSRQLEYLRNRFTKKTQRTLSLPATLGVAVSCSVAIEWMIKIAFVPVATQNLDI